MQLQSTAHLWVRGRANARAREVSQGRTQTAILARVVDSLPPRLDAAIDLLLRRIAGAIRPNAFNVHPAHIFAVRTTTRSLCPQGPKQLLACLINQPPPSIYAVYSFRRPNSGAPLWSAVVGNEAVGVPLVAPPTA
jgi:hypothetical protein